MVAKEYEHKINYEYILFDLDGTLTDPAIGITNSVMYSLEKYGIKVSDRSKLYKFIGPPLWESFEKYYGFSKEEAKQAVEYYREYYKDKGIYENLVYEGLEDLLKLLKASSKTLIVATSKPEIFAKQILEHFNIAKYFTFIAGGNLDGTRVKKDEVISYALESCNILDKSKVIMLGDREHDIIGAKKNGIHSMGVLFGYGDREELENAGADYIVETVSDIGRTLLVK
ncbi:HAD family hydrolase [Clostridium sp. OS1-26]|uniref:HAD family hydrolase n=1 Tax=Clostridium sp. OS1-26 TaxID=3070681 RepID=UPI0027E15AEF|nr:HAD family hydrolase [Clostridium sp. OS1-26]WML33573.1 HAD family hydrolase [Clostridium sp. OS1-26]